MPFHRCGAIGHRDCPHLCRAAGRCRGHRKRLLLARFGAIPYDLTDECRYEPGNRCHIVNWHSVRSVKPVRRSALSTLGSPRKMIFSLSRAWLLNETPSTRSQAIWGRRYRLWLGLRTNPLAMLGLLIIVVVLLLSLIAPLLTPYDPGFQDLANRLASPSAKHWLGSDELGS